MKYYVISVLVCLLASVGTDCLITVFSFKQDIGGVILGLAVGILCGAANKDMNDIG